MHKSFTRAQPMCGMLKFLNLSLVFSEVPSQVRVNVRKSVELSAESADRQISTLSGLIVEAQDRAYVGTETFLSSLRHHQLEINSLWRFLRFGDEINMA